MAFQTPTTSFLRVSSWLQSPLFRKSLVSSHGMFHNESRRLILRNPSLQRTIWRNYSQKPSRGAPPNPTPNLGSPEPHSFTARMRKLSREYGWTVIGVYAALTVADLPFCFLAVKYIGAERVAHAEHVVVGGAKNLLGRFFPNLFDKESGEQISEDIAQAEREEATGEPTFWTKLGLVFLVHKSFIFIRVPLTAAITPKVVKTLRSWGYNIGKRKPKPT